MTSEKLPQVKRMRCSLCEIKYKESEPRYEKCRYFTREKDEHGKPVGILDVENIEKPEQRRLREQRERQQKKAKAVKKQSLAGKKDWIRLKRKEGMTKRANLLRRKMNIEEQDEEQGE